MADLDAFICDLARRRWEWGKNDCLMVICDWIKVCRGFDPAAPWRGGYHSEAEAHAILESEGGILKVLAKTMKAHGIERTDAPQPGDIALVEMPALKDGEIVKNAVGAIVLSGNISCGMSVDAGIVQAAFPRLAVWRV